MYLGLQLLGDLPILTPLQLDDLQQADKLHLGLVRCAKLGLHGIEIYSEGQLDICGERPSKYAIKVVGQLRFTQTSKLFFYFMAGIGQTSESGMPQFANFAVLSASPLRNSQNWSSQKTTNNEKSLSTRTDPTLQ